MDTLEPGTLTTREELRRHYAKPNPRVVAKEIDHVDAVGRAFIERAPFLVMATGSDAGLDCSPKGGEAGFVKIDDDGKTLLIPDHLGNNRIDGLTNLVEDPRIGLIFFVPGVNECYRVNGRARVSVDSDLKRRLAHNGKEPRTVIVVAVEQAFQHCPKALVRSDLWRASKTGRPHDVPTMGAFAAARAPDIEPAAFDEDYAKRMPEELY